MPDKPQTMRRFAFILFLAILVPIVPFVLIGELPGERWLSGQDENALLFGLTGAGLLVGDLLLPIPSSIVGTMLGARLGLLQGFGFTFAGLMLGHALGYGLGYLAASRKGPRANPEGRRSAADTPTTLLVFASRPVPVLAEALTFTAGATGLGLPRFLLAAALGDALYALAMAGNGASLLPGAFLGPGLLIPMALPVIAYGLWRLWAPKAGSGEAD